MAQKMPALFIGHGNPMNAILDNEYSRAWRKLGESLPRPQAILAISAHWYRPGVLVTAMKTPRTIHDFGGFPQALHEFAYPAPGSPELAARVRSLLAPLRVGADSEWGIDHGAWSVLCHLFPNADVPVVQLSMDDGETARFHYDVGTLLRPLRDEGVLVLGSGNVVHNLHAYAWGRHPVEPFEWALRFEKSVRERLVAGDHAALVGYEEMGRDAVLAAPTPDHYLPLLYVAGVRESGEPVSFPVEGIDGGSVSMLSARVG